MFFTYLKGVTSNTDVAQLAETFASSGCSTKVVGVPITLNGDLKNQFVEANVGFDTICKLILSKSSGWTENCTVIFRSIRS